MNPPKLTILTAGTDAACDPETGTCAVPPTPIPTPDKDPHVNSSHSRVPLGLV